MLRSSVSIFASFEVMHVSWHCSKITPDFTLHVFALNFPVVRLSRLWNGQPCHQIWLQLSLPWMKGTVVYGSAITCLARCENWAKLSRRFCMTFDRHSWQTWWRMCDWDVFLALMPGVDTLVTDSANIVLGSPVLCHHQCVHYYSDIFQTSCVLDHLDHYWFVKISLRYAVNWKIENGGRFRNVQFIFFSLVHILNRPSKTARYSLIRVFHWGLNQSRKNQSWDFLAQLDQKSQEQIIRLGETREELVS